MIVALAVHLPAAAGLPSVNRWGGPILLGLGIGYGRLDRWDDFRFVLRSHRKGWKKYPFF